MILFYLLIACFDWKIGIFQQTVVRVYYILKSGKCHKHGPLLTKSQSKASEAVTEVFL